MDTIVFDIETQNFFTDPGVGWDNFAALKISVVGAYSYAENAYRCFTEGEIGDLAKFLRSGDRLVGFSSNRYDIPVVQEYVNRLPEGERFDLRAKHRVDLLEEVESVLGRRVSLDILAQANLGRGKTGHGAQAVELYREGKVDELKKYCLMDVELTKELYDLYVGRGYFLIPDRFTDQMVKVEFPKPNAQTTHLF